LWLIPGQTCKHYCPDLIRPTVTTMRPIVVGRVVSTRIPERLYVRVMRQLELSRCGHNLYWDSQVFRNESQFVMNNTLNVTCFVAPDYRLLYTKCLIECNNYFVHQNIFMSKLYEQSRFTWYESIISIYTKLIPICGKLRLNVIL